MDKEHESQFKRLREVIGIYGSKIHRLEKQNEALIDELIVLFRGIRAIDVGGLDDYSPIALKELLEKIKQKPIEEILKEGIK